jgi:hypothetical protein
MTLYQAHFAKILACVILLTSINFFFDPQMFFLKKELKIIKEDGHDARYNAQ